MSTDGYPAVVDATRVIEAVAKVCHAREIPMPTFEVKVAHTAGILEPHVSVDVDWFPSVDVLGDRNVLIDLVASAFLTPDESWVKRGAVVSHETTLYDIPVEFTIYSE